MIKTHVHFRNTLSCNIMCERIGHKPHNLSEIHD
ncbi:MAG: hypothetical protein ACI9IT_002134 [Glaciecola sp.]|jgi:hypothetical protein